MKGQSKKEMPRKNVERLIMKIEALNWSTPNYLTELLVNVLILAKLKGDSNAIERLMKINTHCADIYNEKGDEKEALSLGALQSFYSYNLTQTMRGNLKVEPIIMEVEVAIKIVYYKLIDDLDEDLFKRGVNLDKKTVI